MTMITNRLREAADKVASVVATVEEREQRAQENAARIEGQRATSEAEFAAAAAVTRDAQTAREEQVRQARQAADDAIQRFERKEEIARNRLDDFRAAHRGRRDLVQTRLDRDLAAVPAWLENASRAAIARICGPRDSAGVEALALILGIERLASPEASDTLRRLLTDRCSSLSTAEYERRLQAAKQHQQTIRTAAAAAAEAKQTADAADPADPADPGEADAATLAAAQAVRLADEAEQTLRALIAALHPEED